ncbi:MAG TPA: AMP-binding protein [Candidatus Acidoferrum sp.]|nr:AMP-binding protein [Candidatus Acidoferrum sp.]
MQVEELLELSARKTPDKTALVCGERRLTYEELEEQANRLAHALIEHGVSRGDRVAIYLENSVEVVLSIFAVLKAGAVFLVINPTTKPDKLAYILNNCRAVALITNSPKSAAVAKPGAPLPFLNTILVAGMNSIPANYARLRTFPLDNVFHGDRYPTLPPPKKCIDIDLAALIYTSGSTGKPKGVMLTHLNIISAATSITTYLETTPDDVILNVLPLSFDYGLYQVLMAFKVGATIVLERSFTYPYAVIEKLIRERVTGFPLVPTISAILLQLNLQDFDFSSLRYITNTAAALPTHHILRLRNLFPHVKLYSMYGLTECKRVSYLPPDQIDVRPGSVGRGMPNEEVYIVDDHGHRAGPNVVGELVVRGSNVMKGYWEAPEATDKVLRPGPLPGEFVLYTGDLFRADEEGFLYFVARKDDIIKTRGEKVSPKEVEEVLYRLDGVAEAAVVGMPDEILGQAIKAVITLREGAQLTERDVQRHCSASLEDFMVPKFIEFRASLPKTSSGKISKRELAIPVGAE